MFMKKSACGRKHVTPKGADQCSAANNGIGIKAKQHIGLGVETAPGPLFDTHAWITTFTGRRFYPFNPSPEQVCIQDIAHALANICRFNGHTRFHYSVAQHSMMVAACVSSGHALQALLHDASEAYLCDLPTPIKLAIPEYAVAERLVFTAIAERFGVSPHIADAVHEADRAILSVEAHALMSDATWAPVTTYILPVHYCDPATAENMFLNKFTEYGGVTGE